MYYRSLLPLAIIGVSATSLAQDLNQTVNYRTVAVPASKAIAELSKLTHVDLGVIAPLDSEPLIICFKDVPLQVAMDKIAAALHGSWSQNKTSFTLTRPDDVKETLQQAAYQEKLADLTKRLKDILKYRATTPLDEATEESELRKAKKEAEAQEAEMEKQQGKDSGPPDLSAQDTKEVSSADIETSMKRWKQEHDDSEKASHATPEGRLRDRILSALDLGVIAKAPEGITVVFSTDPKPLEYKLSLSDEDIQSLIAEQNTYTTAFQRVYPPNSDPTTAAEYFASSYRGRRNLITPFDARIVVEVQTDRPPLDSPEIYVLNSKGEGLLNTNETFGDHFGGWGMTDFISDDTGNESNKFYDQIEALKLPKVKLSPLALELTSLLAAEEPYVEKSSSVRPPSAELTALLEDAGNHDPLGLATSEVLMAAADSQSDNLVACPADSILRTMPDGDLGQGLDCDRLLMQIADDSDVTIKDGWITIAPKHPLEAESKRTNRTSLSTLISSMLEKGYISIEDGAAFAAANKTTVDTSFASNIVGLFQPVSNIDDLGDWHALRFLGLLSNADAQAMINDKKDPITSLSNDAAAELANLVFQSESGYGSEDDWDGVNDGDDVPTSPPVPEATSDADQSTTEEDASDAQGETGLPHPLDDSPFEILEIFPDANSTVSVAERNGMAVRVHHEQNAALIQPAKSDDIVTSDYIEADQWVGLSEIASPRAEGDKQIDTYATCSKRVLQLKVRIANKVTVPFTFTEYHNDMSPYGPISKLPKLLRDEIARMQKEWETSESSQGDDSKKDEKQPIRTPPPPAH